MDYSRFSGEIPSDSFVFNAKLALQLADDNAPTLANLQVDDTGNRVLLRHKSKSTPSLLHPSSKTGWSRIQDVDVGDDVKSLQDDSSRPRRRQPPDASGSAVRLFLRRSIHGCLKKPRDCVGCKALIDGEAVRLMCGHYFEKPCLISTVKACLLNEKLFPPKCCDQPIPRTAFEPLMDVALARLYAEKSVEYNTSERVYCARAGCARFLGPQAKGVHHVYTCPAPACGTRTCSRCKIEVKKAVLHACRPDLPRKSSVSSQKPPAVQAPARTEHKRKPPPPPLAPKPAQVKKTSSFQSIESIAKTPILAVARKISQSLRSSPPASVKATPSLQSLDKSTIVHKVGHSPKPTQALAASPPKQKSKPPPPPPKPVMQLPQVAPALPEKPRSKPPPPPPPPKPVHVQPASTPIPIPQRRHDRVGDAWPSTTQSYSPPRASPPPSHSHSRPSQSPPRLSQSAPRPSQSSPPRPSTSRPGPPALPAPPPRVSTPSMAPPPVPSKPKPQRRATAPAELPQIPGRTQVREQALAYQAHAHAHAQAYAQAQGHAHAYPQAPAPPPERRTRRHETLPPAHNVSSQQSYYYPQTAPPPRKHSYEAPRRHAHEAREAREAQCAPLTPVGAHRLTALDAHVDRLLRAVECYPCRHEWRVDLRREVCDGCARRCVVIYGCTKCVAKMCKTCLAGHA